MKKNTKGILAIVGIIILAVIAGIILFNVLNKDKPSEPNVDKKDPATEYEQGKDPIDMKGNDNVVVGDNGDTTNVSGDLKKSKKFGDCVIDNIKVAYVSGQTEIRATIKNPTANDVDLGYVKINIKNSKGETFRTVDMYLGKIKANQEKVFDLTVQADISNMKDMEFVK